MQWWGGNTTITPVEPSEAATSIETGVINAGFLLFLLLIGITLVFGRFFCGWLCHVVAYQDAAAWLLKQVGLQPRPVRSRLLYFIPFYAAFDMFLWPTVSRLLSGGSLPEQLAMGLTTTDLWERFPGPGITVLTIVIDGFLIVWWLGSKGFCTYGCPYGAIFNISDRLAPGRIRVTDACNGCGHCTAVCTSNVRVHEEVALYKNVKNPACMKCLDCVSSCPKDALFFGFGAPGIASPKPALKPRTTFDFTWGGEIALVLLFIFGILTFRGLYGATPFLLALGAAAMFAFGMAGLARLLTRKPFQFQQHVLRTESHFTTSGIAAAGLGVAFLLFTLHSSVIRGASFLGERELKAALAATGPARDAAREKSHQYLAFAERAGLFPDGKLQFQLASIAMNRRQFEPALKHLETANAAAPRYIEPWIRRAELLLMRGDRAGAAAVLDAAIAANPTNGDLKARRGAISGG